MKVWERINKPETYNLYKDNGRREEITDGGCQINTIAVDKVKILTLQDNYIDITSQDNSDVVIRSR